VRKQSTIRDVAREAGVSVAVVSRVLNDGTGPVASQTRAKVVDVIERLGYQPRAAARELQARSTTTIGLVLADLANPFFARLADRVVWEARARGINVLLLTNQEDPHLEAESIETLVGRSVGSVIATPTGGNPDKWSRLIDLGVNVVFVDREIDELPEIDVVAIGNDRSAEVTTRHLLGLGHKRIAFISGPLTTSTGRDRLEGFRRAMAAARVDVDERLIHAIPFRGDSGGDAVSALLALPAPPTGLIVGNTAQVRSALHRVKQSGISVPDDLSLIVFDDNPWTELVSPPLSVVRQPIDMLALHSVELAVGRLKGALTEPPRRIRVEADFVQRSSSAPHHPSSVIAG
jgi:LacI family transcriptional regulator